jgi:citrate synthase
VLYHYGMKEFEFYTVMFGVSRTMGISAQLLSARAAGNPLVRPKSIPMTTLKKMVGME